MSNQNTPETLALLKLLADETRLRIINILAEGDSYVELIASKLELTPATVCYHLKKMEATGMVRCSRAQFYIIYSLNKDVFDRPLRELVITKDTTADREAAYEREVIANFFKYGRLTRLPAQRKKQEIILREIARRFEPGRDYPEPEVNAIISEVYDDYCTVRREMIGCGLMTRQAVKGAYDVYRLVVLPKDPA